MVGHGLLDRMILARDEMPISLDRPTNARLVVAKAKSNEDGKRVILSLIWQLGCHFIQ